MRRCRSRALARILPAGALLVGVLLGMALVPATAEAVPPPAAVPSRCEPTPDGYRCLVGPVPVPADRTVEFVTGVAAPSEAGYLTSAQATLVDSAGQPVDHRAVHLHHAVWANPMRDDLTCDAYDDGLPDYERFFASGKERTAITLPDGYGYHWSNRAPQPHTRSAPYWALVAMLDGGSGHRGVRIELDIAFVPEGEAEGIVPVRPVWLDVRNCSSHPVYDVEEGSGQGGVHEETWTHPMPLDGRLVAAGGHLHDGGLGLRLERAADGRELFTSRPVYSRPGRPRCLTGMTTFADPQGPRVSAGEEIRLISRYDSTRAWPNVMGIMLAAVAPAGPRSPVAGVPEAADPTGLPPPRLHVRPRGEAPRPCLEAPGAGADARPARGAPSGARGTPRGRAPGRGTAGDAPAAGGGEPRQPALPATGGGAGLTGLGLVTAGVALARRRQRPGVPRR